MPLFCFAVEFIILRNESPVTTFACHPAVVAAPTYEAARSRALEVAQEHVRDLSKLGLTAYFHLDYLPQ